jgi:peptidoglycan lytic transglycosylase G
VSGGYGRGGGRQGYGEPGYGDDDYGQQGQQPGSQPSWDDPYWQQRGQPGQPGGWPGQGQPAQGTGYGPEYGQQGGWPDPRSQGQRQGGAPRRHDPRSPRQGQRGMGPAQQRGYDPRSADPRRGYPPGSYQGRGGDPRSGQGGYGGWDPDGRDDSFVPGLGRRDEFDSGPGSGRGRGGRNAGAPGGYDDGRRGQRGGGGDDGSRGGGDWDDLRPRRRGPVRRLAPWVALLVILTPLALGAYYVYHLYENHTHPADYAGKGIAPAVTVQVKSGDNAFSLAPRLLALGVIASERSFEDAAEASSNSTGLEVGYYKLNHHMQSSLAWAALLNPKNRVQLTVTIPEGKRASQVVLLLAKGTNIPAANFQKVLSKPAQLGLPSYAKGKVEGYLFPATYTIVPNETAQQILKAMVARYNFEAKQVKLVSAAKNVGLTPAQVIIEASMAQAEGGSNSDFPKIAEVIHNRLRSGMHLQFDSTVLYGLGKYAISATIAQTKIPGPYNTYLNAGLPIGPISNPGDLAIRAILHPATGDYLYFLTKPGGKSEFSASPLPGQG